MKRTPYPYAPIWANIVYQIARWIACYLVNPVSYKLSDIQCEVIERTCACDQCIKRHPERAQWKHAWKPNNKEK